MSYGIGTFERDGERIAALVVDERAHDLRPAFGDEVTIDALLRDWRAALPRLEAFAAEVAGGRGGAGTPLDRMRCLPPVTPGQIVCAGANYTRHVTQIVFTMLRNNTDDARSDDELRAAAAESARARAGDEPFFFTGLPSAISGANDDVVLWGPHREHDWELELAVVIGATAHRVDEADAMSYVAGYTMSNDITVRDAMFRRDIPMTDFLHGKNRPTFFPTGPYLVPRACVDDPTRLRIHLTVNGETMQDDEVSDMICGIPRLVSAASHATVLSPGDLVLTGSPAGNAGHHGNRWLRPGDVIESSITQLGTQRNVCVAPPDPEYPRQNEEVLQ